ESVLEGLFVGPGPEQGREDQAQRRPGAIASKLDRRQVSRLEQPEEGILESLKVIRESGTTIRVLVRHTRFLSGAGGSGFRPSNRIVSSKACRIKTYFARLLTDLHQERSDSKPFWA